MKGIYLLELDTIVPSGDEGGESYAEDVEISLHALTGLSTSHTMQLMVCLSKNYIRTLVDSRSTHCFITTNIAERLGLVWSSQQVLTVGVANGERVSCLGIYPQAGITIDNEKFLIDFYVIALEGYELVLGYNWLRQLGPILWDFDKLTMAFWWMNHRVKFQGLAAPKRPLLAATMTDNLLNLLLTKYRDIFSKPEGLPPAKRFDHRIHLLLETAPVVVRPYRYPQLLKDEIEKQCDDMLQQGLIRPSTSAFSSPVLLVRKKDMTWRFYVDFRALNAVTVKDKFPIPVVDELLDELWNARFFSKIDLRSGYHQVLMHEDDIAKMSFCTHQGHFEFLVMPFCITNAPATFQALMNETLKSYIQKIVLVFSTIFSSTVPHGLIICNTCAWS
jgi:hypothetical protein